MTDFEQNGDAMNLTIFDLDDTLTDRYQWQLRPHVVAWLAFYRPQKVAIATNQGGVGLRYWMEPRPEEGYTGFGDPARWGKMPTEADVRDRLHYVARQITDITGEQVLGYAAYRYFSKSKGIWSPVPVGREAAPEWSTEWRKPGAGMLLHAAAEYGVQASNCLFVGNSDDDRLAAQAAGMTYCDEADLFGQHIKEQ